MKNKKKQKSFEYGQMFIHSDEFDSRICNFNLIRCLIKTTWENFENSKDQLRYAFIIFILTFFFAVTLPYPIYAAATWSATA